MESPELLFKSTSAVKINLKRQSELEFHWLSSRVWEKKKNANKRT
jgi:hypothetical protein